MQKKTIKVLCAIMVLLMLVPMMFACDNGNSEDTNDTSKKPNDTNIVYELELPEKHTFDGETFTILTAGHVAYNDFDFTAEEESVLGKAQYMRNQTIKEENDVVIEAIKQEYKLHTEHKGYDTISTQVLAEDETYKLGVIGGYDVAMLAEQNCLYDLNSVPTIATEKPWWDQNANNDLTINGMLFFTNGALTAAYSESTYVIYLNQKLAAEALPEGTDVYQMVRDGKWTIDQLAAFSKTVTEDMDGDGNQTWKDRFGLYVWDDSILGMVEGAGSKIVTVGADGKLALTLNSESTVHMFDKFTEIAYNKAYALTYQRHNSEGMMAVDSFQENKALFWATSNVNTNTIRDMESSFGILPYPKLDENQDRYYSTIAPYNSQFVCVPFIETEETLAMIGVVAESLAYYGEKITWPACYEQTLKGAFSRDDGTMDMLDIIYDNYVYDMGLYYKVGDYASQIMNLLRKFNTGFASMYETNRITAETKVDSLNANFDQVVKEWNAIKGQ